MSRISFGLLLIALIVSAADSHARVRGGASAQPPIISGVILSNGTNFTTPASPGITIDTLAATCSAGNCFGSTFALAITGSCSGASFNSSFVIPIGSNNLNINGSTVTAGGYPIGIAVILPGAINSGVCFPFTLVGANAVSQTIASMALSNSSTSTGLSSGTAVGILSATMNPPTPIFAGYTSGGLSLTPTVTGCNGADNASFQIVNDQLQTNAALTAGIKQICVAATQAGATLKQNFAITVGHLIVATTQAACAGHAGTGADPWPSLCIQQASNAAVKGDIILLSAGNWQLNTADASNVTIVPAVTIVGVGSGNTFSAQGNPNNANGTNFCPTSSSSITCLAIAGPSAVSGVKGQLIFEQCGAGDAGGVGLVGMSHLFLDSSSATGGGAANSMLFVYGCNPPGSVVFDDMRILGYNGAITPEANFNIYSVYAPISITDSVLASPPISPCGFAGAAPWFYSGGSNLTMRNIYMFESGQPAIGVDNIVMTGSTMLMDSLWSGCAGIQGGAGFEGCAIGPWIYNCNGSLVGSTGVTLTNNYLNGGIGGNASKYGVGGGLNDPGTGGGETDLVITGNTITGSIAGVDSCVWHYYDVTKPNNPYDPANTNRPYFGCVPNAGLSGGAEGMQINGHMNPDCSISATPTNPFTITNNSILATVSAQIDAAGTGGMRCFLANVTGNLSGTTISGISGGAGMAGIVVGSVVDDPSGGGHIPGGTTVTGIGVGACGSSNCVTVNNAMPTVTGDLVRFAVPHDNSVVGVNANANYLSSPNNIYLSSATSLNETLGAIVPGATNFCVGSTFTGTDSVGCRTSGFTSTPTVTFGLGVLEQQPKIPSAGTHDIPITNPSFTAQYGAVQWLASTSPSTPSTGDTRWSYVPPAFIPSVTHGDTIYMWVMDQANHISAPASALIP